MKISALLTDLYELTMMQGYFLKEWNPQVVFDMFFRKQPFASGFAVFAGLNDLLNILHNFTFLDDDIEYLAKQNLFHSSFLDYLHSYQFKGDLYAMDEGTPVFPGEPIVRVHGSLIETQLIESILLNTLNFQTLVATKAARIQHASHNGKILEFGLRRAQGIDGSLSASRAAYIGGASATSNTLAGKLYNIPVKGTMAHSWIMAFESELEAFRSFAEIYPDNAILLIDTFDTLGSGIKHAITIGKELKAKGKNIGVRLDSGDLYYLSKKIREALDKAGLPDAVITASNDLNEEIIHQLVTDGAPIDSWGVGTNLVTGGSDSSLSGVYKLCAKEKNNIIMPTIKISNNTEKISNPGIKQVYRFFDSQNYALADLITLEDEKINQNEPISFFHPSFENTFFTLNPSECMEIRPLLSKKMQQGNIMVLETDLSVIQQRACNELKKIDKSYKRIINPHIYKVSLSKSLNKLKIKMIQETKIQPIMKPNGGIKNKW